MKRTILSLICLILTPWPRPVAAQYAGSGQENVDFSLSADWQPAFTKETKSVELIEFLRKGDDINDWKELVTDQSETRKSMAPSSPQAFLDNSKMLRERLCPGITKWNVIQQDEYSILYEWQLTKACAGAPNAAQAIEQHDIARVVYGKYNIFELHYAAKGKGLAPDVCAKWISWLSATTFTIDANIDQTIPFAGDQVAAAIKSAMQTFGCSVTTAETSLVECVRRRPNVFLRGSPSGGEKVTAVLEPQGTQTRVRITTGMGIYGRFNKENWS